MGPGDLGLRIRQANTELTLEDAFETVAAACAKHGVAWGTPVGTAEDLAKRQQQGAQLLAHGGDFGAIRAALQAGSETFVQTPR